MARVYVAEHTRLGRKVALKLLRPGFADNTQVIRRFFAEARAVNCIKHRNIIEVTDIIEEPEKYYIMELLAGETLGERLSGSGIPTLATTIEIAAQLASVLAAVHKAGVVHYDIKPDNVFLAIHDEGRDFVKLLDFGIAKLPDEEPSLVLTQSGEGEVASAVVGTPTYMSPEQAQGGSFDHRSDIYSFGVLLYELVTGRPPFEADNPVDMAVQHVTADPTPPSEVTDLPHAVPAELEALILQCLAKDPDDRLNNMEEAGFHLDRVRGALSGQSTLSRLLERHKLPALAAGLGLLALTMLIIALAVTSGDDQATTPEPSAATPTAPGPADAATQTPAAPVTVEVFFDSVPKGAFLFEQGGEDPLGATPVSVALEKSDRIRSFELRLDGYRPATAEVVPRKGARVVVKLEAEERKEKKRKKKAKKKKKRWVRPPAATTTEKPPKKSLKDVGVIDPFAK